jgi:hypothetical protein
MRKNYVGSSRLFQISVTINQTARCHTINSTLDCSQSYTNGARYVLATVAGLSLILGQERLISDYYIKLLDAISLLEYLYSNRRILQRITELEIRNKIL